MSKREQLIELGRLPLTEEGWIAVLSFAGKAYNEDLERVTSRQGSRKDLVGALAARLRLTDRIKGGGFGAERDAYDRGLTLKLLAKGAPRAFLKGAPEGMGTYVKDARGILDPDPTEDDA